MHGSAVVSPDETSWKVGGHLWWLWVSATARTIVYPIQAGRGFAEAAAVLGVEFAGVLVRDGWAPYRHFEHAGHQTCLAHLLRRSRLREIAEAHPRAAWPRQVAAVLQDALAVRDRFTAREMSAHGAGIARGHLITGLVDPIRSRLRTRLRRQPRRRAGSTSRSRRALGQLIPDKYERHFSGDRSHKRHASRRNRTNPCDRRLRRMDLQ